MKKDEAISYLENLKRGEFLTVNIPIYRGKVQPVTVMYMGKDKEKRYNFIDSGIFKMSREFLEKGTVTIDKKFDRNVAIHINSKLRTEQERKQKYKNTRNTR